MPSSSTSDTDSDAPEAVTLAESKKSAKRQNGDVEKAHAAQRKKNKLKNQEKDKLLKKQAERRKEKGKGAADPLSVEARMERAMKEAEEETSEEEELVDIGDDHIEIASEWKGLGNTEEDDRYPLANESDEEMGSPDEDDFNSNDDEASDDSRTDSPPNHLPDHIFEAAFASQKARQNDNNNAKKATGKPKHATAASKAKKRKNKSKDIIIGSKTVRTLSSTLKASREGDHIASRKVQRYIDRTLSLKGGNSMVKGWQRRPANIGVFKQSGPAMNFVRS